MKGALICAASMPRVRHFTGDALFPGQLLLAADRLSCDAVFIGESAADFSAR